MLSELPTSDLPPPDSPMYRLTLTSPTVSSDEIPIDRVMTISHGPNWMTPLFLYLQEGVLPQDRKVAQSLRGKVSLYTVIDDNLYQRSFLAPLLKCIDVAEYEYYMLEVH